MWIHFHCRGSLSVQKMKQLKMNVSDAKLKVLQQLSLVELDSKGHVRLVLWAERWLSQYVLSSWAETNHVGGIDTYRPRDVSYTFSRRYGRSVRCINAQIDSPKYSAVLWALGHKLATVMLWRCTVCAACSCFSCYDKVYCKNIWLHFNTRPFPLSKMLNP